MREDHITNGNPRADNHEAQFPYRKSFLARYIAIGVALLVLLCLALLLGDRGVSKAQRIEQANRLKNLGLALRTSGADYTQMQSWEELVGKGIGNRELIIDPVSGQPFILARASKMNPSAILVYPPTVEKTGGNCVMADGSIQWISSAQFKSSMSHLTTN